MRIHVWTVLAAAFVVVLAIGPSPVHVHALQETARAFDLEETTIRALIQDQQAGRRTARQIASEYIARIQALDRSGPTLHAVIELNPDALTIADALDAERGAGPFARPASRHSGVDQRQHRYGGSDDDDRRVAGARRIDRRARCVHRRAAARRRRSDSGQDQYERVGELPVDATRPAAGAAVAAS